jgi:sialidase-1
MTKKIFCGFKLTIILSLLIFSTSCNTDQQIKTDEKGKELVLLLEPRPGNPKNFSGDFIRLKDGRILYLYAYGVGDRVADDAPHCTVARYSSDNGKTWTTDDVIMHIEGGLSFLRLPDDRIALFYLRASNFGKELYPYMIISDDETKTWSAPVKCANEPGYYTINNDRVVQLKNERIVIPVAFYGSGESNGDNGIYAYYSDDTGETWNRSQQVPNPKHVKLEEPGVIELKNGDLMMFIRTDAGLQYLSYSSDKGEHWSEVQPGCIRSPLSPASIKRIPSTGDLLLVWNDNYDPQHKDGGNRSPLCLAISKDEGKTWEKRKTLEGDPYGWYCYTTIRFFGDHVLLGHATGNTNEYIGLAVTQVTRLSLDWIYKDATTTPTVETDNSGVIVLSCPDREAEIYYSLERKMPDILYDSPVTVSRTTPLWVQVIADGKTKSDLVTTYVGTNILQPSIEEPGNNQQGLTYDYYEGVVATVDDIDNLIAKTRGVTQTVIIESRLRDYNFAFRFSGYIDIPKDGKYTFYLASNDGSSLYIDDNELINHDGGHAITEKSNAIALRQGKHKIAIKYFQLMGGLGLKLYWEGPGITKQSIPNSVLFTEN